MPSVFVKTKEMSHEEWLESRNKGIGGSDIATILGLNPYKSKMELYLEKTEQIENKVNNSAVYWGNMLESLVAEEFTNQTGKKVRNRNAILQHKNYPYMLANVDRMVVGEKAVLECKTTSAYKLKEWESDEIPAAYILQVQWYLAVLGEEYKKGYIACLIGGQKYVWKEIDRDDELIGMMIDAAKEFWLEHVVKLVPPAVDGSEASSELLKKLYPDSEIDSEIELDEKADEIISNYEEAKKQIDYWNAQKRLAENQLKSELGEHEVGQATGHIVTWKPVSSSRPDAKKLKEEFPEVYKQVLKTTKTRRFVVK